MVILMEWTGRPLQPRRKPPNLGQKFATLQICTSSKAMPTRPTPSHCSHGCQQSYIEFLALPSLLFALQGERLFLVSANSDKTSHHTSNMLNSHKNHRDDQPPFLLTVSCEALPPTRYRPFSAEAEKNLSVCYILPEVGAWSNVTINSKLE